ncbi:hypothetical protein KAFR_0D03990 [Kazachstania africana CBS 2517]|uniref:Bicarbonate transporter-like transmembrane domain-containing protein n=1 Tax=Kazachstania africana (strain ATCC 22294 / BCRC 22015 / CBS 2517 / CECT 1963 / NBRC 1671 / NRRL Y-8276) TaxID=1071382 RepID=H2AUJ7_KAZAF|nr:hypothetical protein KAFR_0D03990 [Kazachstania africana CBS 2517]CCF58047.1 hypothetical protein KAFR_0D03990 [Kazachstania africana CBS 2517]
MTDASSTSGNTVDTGLKQKRRHFPPLGKGIYMDFKDRFPYYWQDWRDAWDYRVIPSLVETYFNNLLPAIAFAQDAFDRTDNLYGVNEILLASALGGVVFGLFAGQPLCIVGVTGPITIFNYTVYSIIKPLNANFFGFMFWICIWAMIFHLILAFTNAVSLLQYVTTFPCDIFGLFISVVYIQKGIQILGRQYKYGTIESGFASVVVALVMFIFGFMFKQATRTPLFNHKIRTFISDYSTALSVLFWSAFIHFGGELNNVKFEKLPITKAFIPTATRERSRSTWLAYEPISTRNVFIALPFGIIVTILFYFDHNVSSLMAQRYQYKLKKPSAFHWDYALLGITTGIAGVLGIPAPNGLIPQAPLHTKTLLVHDRDMNVVRCVEQRFTNTVQGLLMIGTMTRPLLVCLGQIPQAVLSGLFFLMGFQGVLDSVIMQRIFWFFTDPLKKDPASPLLKVRKRAFILFISLGVIGAAAEIAISATIAAIAFPIVLLLTVLVCFLFPRFFTKEELEILDPNVAQSFTIKNLLLENLCSPPKEDIEKEGANDDTSYTTGIDDSQNLTTIPTDTNENIIITDDDEFTSPLTKDK